MAIVAERAWKKLTILEKSPLPLSHWVNERFPWPAEEQAFLPVYAVGTKVSLNYLPADTVHVTGFYGEDFGVL